MRTGVPLVLAVLLTLGGCTTEADVPAADGPPTASAAARRSAESPPPADPPSPTPSPTGPTALGRFPERVYVPNTRANTLHVIDPETRRIVSTQAVPATPHHVTPSWDLTRLYVNDTGGNRLSVVDPATGEITRTIEVVDPYNLYFTPDGETAIVVAERLSRLDLRDPETWELRASIPVERAGIDHGAFTRDGRYFVASAEFSGWLLKIDLRRKRVVDELRLGGEPIDVVRIPGSDLMLVANQADRDEGPGHGVHVVDAPRLRTRGFVPTGRGAHGILLSRDHERAYVSNRLGGTISVLDLDSLEVTERWEVGGSPDMGQLNPDGTELWISNRYHSSVSVIDTTTGEVLARIPTDAGPHGLVYFPTVDRHSLGHNGVYLTD